MYKLIVGLFIIFGFTNIGFAQGHLNNDLHFEINRIYPPISITKEKLSEAQNLIDLNAHYKSSWVRDYIAVEILTNYQGKTKKAVSKNGILSQKQKNLMNKADLGTDISVKVYYMPKNNLTDNERKEMAFSFSVAPENDASYTEGEQELNQYLKIQAIDKIPAGSFKNFDLTAVKFTIDEEGQVINVHIFEGAKDEKVNQLLLETLQKMPNWKPATYSNGLKVKQEFVLTVGNMDNCMVHLLNIRRD